jgi:hypothetical protein
VSEVADNFEAPSRRTDDMRTTVTLYPDVAAEIDRRRGEHGLKEEVDRLLRIGLRHDDEDKTPGPPVRTEVFSVGRPLIADVDDVAGALARAEGEAFR